MCKTVVRAAELPGIDAVTLRKGHEAELQKSSSSGMRTAEGRLPSDVQKIEPDGEYVSRRMLRSEMAGRRFVDDKWMRATVLDGGR